MGNALVVPSMTSVAVKKVKGRASAHMTSPQATARAELQNLLVTSDLT